MVDTLTLVISHALLFLVVWRVLGTPDPEDKSAIRRHRGTKG